MVGAVTHPEPPAAPDGRGVHGAFIIGNDTAASCMTDIRTASRPTHRWRYAVRTRTPGVPVRLRFEPHHGSLPPDGGPVLVDNTAGRVVNIERTRRYRFTPRSGKRSRLLQLVSGDSARFAAAAQPGDPPMRAAVAVARSRTAGVLIRYDVPDRNPAAAVTLGIHALGSELVRVIVSGMRAPGRHAVVWDSRDHHGRRLPAAVYVCRLRVENGGTHSMSFALTRQP
jgi:hypothetical protein